MVNTVDMPVSELDRYIQSRGEVAVFSREELTAAFGTPHNFAGRQTITYGFPQFQTPDYDTSGANGLLHGFTQNQIDATKMVLNYWDDYIAPSFVIYEQGDPLGDVADTRFFNRDQSGTATGGFTGDVHVYNYSTIDPETRDFKEGQYQFQLMVHEVGHTLGLDHTFESPYEGGIQYLQDSNIFSTMAYTTRSAAGAEGAWLMPVTPMLADVTVAQALYGADMTTRTGDDVYGFNSTIADRPAFDFSSKAQTGVEIGPITIWDAGGVDTIDFSGFSRSVLDLRDGEFSSANGNSMLVSIAYDAQIENGVGSSGIDTIFGNEVANHIVGGQGADLIFADEGDDVVFGDNMLGETPLTGTIALVEFNPSPPANSSGHYYADHYFEPGSAVSLPSTAITVEAVIRITEVPGSYATLIHYSVDDVNNGEWSQQTFALRVNANSSALHLSIAGEDINTGIHPTALLGDDPQRISITWDSADGSYAIYLDGVEKASGTAAMGGSIPADGYLHFMTGWWMKFEGSIGDIRIWDHARDATQVRQSAFVEATGDEDGLVALWQADGAQTGVLPNRASEGNFPDLLIRNISQTNPIAESISNMGEKFADQIVGGLGNDTLHGEAGDDVIEGGEGSDTIDGGAGNDTANYATSSGGVNIQLQYRIIEGGDAAGDTLRSVENLTGSDHNDMLVGNALANVLKGGNGADILKGLGGADQLFGQEGDDWIYVDNLDTAASGGEGFDRLMVINGNGVTNAVGANGFEIATGNVGDDTFDGTGAASAVTLRGLSGNDILTGGDFNDYIYGDRGADELRGGEGLDRLFIDELDTVIDGGGGLQDRVIVQQYASALTGVTLNLAQTNVEAAYGGAKADIFDGSASSDDLSLYGRSGSDTLIGGDGNDRLWGDGNDAEAGDILQGGKGNDYLYGGLNVGGATENDQFVFNAEWGDDRIFDFADNGVEKIDFSSVTGITSLADLTISDHPTDAIGPYALISYADAGGWSASIRVYSMVAADLGNDDFIFV